MQLLIREVKKPTGVSVGRIGIEGLQEMIPMLKKVPMGILKKIPSGTVIEVSADFAPIYSFSMVNYFELI
jgi:hypothetical protein